MLRRAIILLAVTVCPMLCLGQTRFVANAYLGTSQLMTPVEPDAINGDFIPSPSFGLGIGYRIFNTESRFDMTVGTTLTYCGEYSNNRDTEPIAEYNNTLWVGSYLTAGVKIKRKVVPYLGLQYEYRLPGLDNTWLRNGSGHSLLGLYGVKYLVNDSWHISAVYHHGFSELGNLGMPDASPRVEDDLYMRRFLLGVSFTLPKR